MDAFHRRTEQILRAHASGGLINGSGACKTTPMKACIGKAGTVKRKTALKKLTVKNDKLLSKKSGSKTVVKRKPAKKAVVKKTAKKPVAKKCTTTCTIPKKRKVTKAKPKTVKKKVTKPKTTKKRVTKKKVKGSGFAGGCADCPYCSGSGQVVL